MKVLVISEIEMDETGIFQLFSKMLDQEPEEIILSEYQRFLNGEQVILEENVKGITSIEKMGTEQ